MRRGQRLLRVLRAEQEPEGISQVKLARKAGLQRLRYRAIELGDVEPSTDEKNAVAAALGVKVSDIAWPGSALKRTA